jgi:cation diffusion facilitator CzcD-associated flavoprotein CzcO
MSNTSRRRLQADGPPLATDHASPLPAARIRVCVIGAGVSGLAAIKAAKENDFDVDAFESSDGIGGLWSYHDKRHGVAAFTHINVSEKPPACLPLLAHVHRRSASTTTVSLTSHSTAACQTTPTTRRCCSTSGRTPSRFACCRTSHSKPLCSR